MINFVDNWMRPVELTAAQNSVALDLPDGVYALTVADSDTAATRWEVMQVGVTDGQAMLGRAPGAQDWPEGSVIYCAVNSMILISIFDELAALRALIEAQ
ncbi:MAG: hypothetical protein JKY26_06765 [Pseudomonas sp.]|nr:hypothetical protein [Pseudomonas sp.]